MKINPFTNPLVAAEVTRRTCQPIPSPPHVGGYAITRPRSALHALTTSLSRCFALLTAATLFTHAAFAAGGPKPPPPPPPQPSSGTVVLSYPNASSWGLAASPSGKIYAVGNTYTTWSQLVLSSSDGGNSWLLIDDFAPVSGFVGFSDDLGGGIASDPVGNLYVTGQSYGNAQPDQWYVRRSTDGGASWTTVDDVVMTGSGGSTDDMDIATDAAGDVYVSACDFYSLNSNFYYNWTIRKGVGGTSFSTVDVLPNSYPKDIFVHPTAGIFVVGETKVTIKNQTSWAWLVRRSTDGGASWANVDTFQLSSSKSSVAMGIGADASGNLYVVGTGSVLYKGINSSHWIVRKSTNGGNSWTTVDDYQLVADNSSQARCIAKDAYGNLFVAGLAGYPPDGKWIVRKSAGGTGPWTTVDVQGGYPNAIAPDALGNVFVGGDGGGNWLVKKY